MRFIQCKERGSNLTGIILDEELRVTDKIISFNIQPRGSYQLFEEGYSAKEYHLILIE